MTSYLMRTRAPVMAALLFSSAVVATPAMAETFDLGTLGSGQSTSTGPINRARGSFTDTITFGLTSKGSGSVGYNDLYFKLGSTVFRDITNTSLSLTGPAGFGTRTISNFQSGMDYMFNFTSGSYTATLSGMAAGRNGGTYDFGVSAPVPEPEAWLSMIFGVAAAGWFARRKKKSGSTPALVAA